MVLNASNVQIYQNTFFNSLACFGRNARTAAGDHFGWHPSTGPDVDKRDGHIFVNNLLASDETFARPLLFVWQPVSLCQSLNKPQLKQLDYNVYVRGTAAKSSPIILWSPAANEKCLIGLASLEELHKLNLDLESHGGEFLDYHGPLFKCLELGNYQLLPTFPGLKTARQLPPSVRTLLSPTQPNVRYIGAYPPLP